MVPPKCHPSDYDGNGNEDRFMLDSQPHIHTVTHTQAPVRAHTHAQINAI